MARKQTYIPEFWLSCWQCKAASPAEAEEKKCPECAKRDKRERRLQQALTDTNRVVYVAHVVASCFDDIAAKERIRVVFHADFDATRDELYAAAKRCALSYVDPQDHPEVVYYWRHWFPPQERKKRS